MLPSQSDLHQPAVNRLPLHQALFQSLFKDDCDSFVVLIVISTTVERCLSRVGSVSTGSCPSALADSKNV